MSDYFHERIARRVDTVVGKLNDLAGLFREVGLRSEIAAVEDTATRLAGVAWRLRQPPE